MRKKISLTLLFIMITVLCILENKTYASEYDSSSKLYYEEKNGTISIVNCDDSVTKVTIPSKINGKNVTSIGDNAFMECIKLENITIPSGIKTIGNKAFIYCTSLTSITIPSSVESIGDGSFNACSKLENITIPRGIKTIGRGAFGFCTSLTSITIPSSVISIADEAFDGCTNLKEIKVNNDNTKYISNNGILYTKNLKTLIRCPEGKLNAIIPNGVENIRDEAFKNCQNLTSVKIPNSVINIGDSVFFFCKSLTSITIPDGVTNIGENVFGYCTSLPSITIPSSVTSIGEAAFFHCKNLTSVIIPNSVTSIGDYVFRNCWKLTKIRICNASTIIGKIVIDEKVTIYAYKNSTAEEYATKNKNTFVELLKDDVSKNDWFYDAVKYTYDNNMITGTDSTHFSPYTKLSRAMLVTILWRMEGTPKATTNKFSDIKTTDWYYNAVNWAASKGIVNGYANGKFGPNDNITRQQLSAILMNYARYKGKKVTLRTDLNKYIDTNKIDNDFKNAVSWCVANKIISGKDNGTRIDPKGTATRAEAAAMLRTYCLNVK